MKSYHFTKEIITFYNSHKIKIKYKLEFYSFYFFPIDIFIKNIWFIPSNNLYTRTSFLVLADSTILYPSHQFQVYLKILRIPAPLHQGNCFDWRNSEWRPFRWNRSNSLSLKLKELILTHKSLELLSFERITAHFSSTKSLISTMNFLSLSG